ncbi:MAG: hypothetical protein H6742_20720 [Alphaproteobacteria bacterium]|nr:hypothetical protein [Alphaproteobacteria bacterium]
MSGRLPILLAMLVLGGCSARHRKAKRAEGNYDVGVPGGDWAKVEPGGADHAWHHVDLGASIYTDSNCESRFDDSPLPRLASSMVFGIARGQPLRDEERVIDERAGLVRTWQGQLDGVDVQLGVAVLKKHDCVYDVTVVAPPDSFEASWDAFERVLAGFRTHER